MRYTVSHTPEVLQISCDNTFMFTLHFSVTNVTKQPEVYQLNSHKNPTDLQKCATFLSFLKETQALKC